MIKKTAKTEQMLEILRQNFTDEDYKEYSYLTFGYKEKEQLFYDQVNSYPLFLSYSQE